MEAWPPKFYPATGPRLGIQGLAESEDGALLFGPSTGIGRLAGSKVEAYPLSGSVQQFVAARLLRDREGNLWIGTRDRGLVHVHRGRTDYFTQVDGLSGDLIEAVFIDCEDNIWVATDGGLDRFREFAVTSLFFAQWRACGPRRLLRTTWRGRSARSVKESLPVKLVIIVPRFVHVEGTSTDLAPLIRDEVYRIAVEAAQRIPPCRGQADRSGDPLRQTAT